MTSGECAIKGRTRRAKEQRGTAHTQAHTHMCTYSVRACTVHIHPYACTRTGAHMHKHKYTHVQAYICCHTHTPGQVLTEKLLWEALWVPRTW